MDINLKPLNLLGERRFNFLPPHLEPIAINESSWSFSNEIPRWIEQNLNSRYFYGSLTKLVDNRIVAFKAVAFEDPTETTLFLLKCPHIGQN